MECARRRWCMEGSIRWQKGARPHLKMYIRTRRITHMGRQLKLHLCGSPEPNDNLSPHTTRNRQTRAVTRSAMAAGESKQWFPQQQSSTMKPNSRASAAHTSSQSTRKQMLKLASLAKKSSHAQSGDLSDRECSKERHATSKAGSCFRCDLRNPRWRIRAVRRRISGSMQLSASCSTSTSGGGHRACAHAGFERRLL